MVVHSDDYIFTGYQHFGLPQMMDALATIPASVWAFSGGIVIAVIGVWFSRKKDKAAMTTKNIEGARIVWNRYDKQLAEMQSEIARLRQRSSKQSARISSLEQNEKANQKWIGELERMTEKLQRDNKELRRQYDELLAKYKALKVEVNHSSRPDLRAGE